MKRKSFIIHYDSLDVLDELTDKQIAELFIAIRDYHLGKEVKLEGLMKVVFIPFKNQFDRDLEKYKNICNRNSLNGAKGGRPKATQKTQSVISEPKKPDSDNDNKSDSDNKNINNNINEELEKIITYWNGVFKRKFEITNDLREVYKKVKTKYTIDDIRLSIENYVKVAKPQEYEPYRLTPYTFFKQKNGFTKFFNM